MCEDKQSCACKEIEKGLSDLKEATDMWNAASKSLSDNGVEVTVHVSDRLNSGTSATKIDASALQQLNLPQPSRRPNDNADGHQGSRTNG